MAYLMDESEDEKLKGSAPGVSAPQTSSSAGTPGAQNKKYTQSNYTSGRMILNKNQDAPQADLSQGFKQKAEERSQAIGQQAKDYNAGLDKQRQDYTFKDQDVEGALQGEGSQFKRIQEALRGPKAINQFDAKSGLDIQDINKLNTSAGVSDEFRNLAQKRGDYNYGRGQSSLDAAIYGRSAQGRNQQVNEALAKRQQVENQAQELNKNLAERRAEVERQTSSSLKGLGEKLKSRQEQIRNEALAQAKSQRAFDEGRGRSQESARLYDTAFKQAMAQAANEAGGDKRVQADLEKAYRDALVANRSRIADITPTTESELYNADQASMFNRINALLGGGSDVSERQNQALQGQLGQTYNDLLARAREGVNMESEPGRRSVAPKKDPLSEANRVLGRSDKPREEFESKKPSKLVKKAPTVRRGF